MCVRAPFQDLRGIDTAVCSSCSAVHIELAERRLIKQGWMPAGKPLD